MVDKIIKEAAKWEGYIEKASNYRLESKTANAGSNNYTCFSEWYKNEGYGNFQAQPWCAIFVSYVFGNVISNSESVMQHYAYCPTGVAQFKKMEKWFTTAQKGDVIFFKDSNGIAIHTGIVINTEAKNIYTIEGNTSLAVGVVANGGCVKKKSYNINNKNILGYGRPKWEAIVIENKYSYDNTVNNLVVDGIITIENMAYWEKVLDGRELPNKDYIRELLERYHVKMV